jgi:type III secretory pathway component EscT
MYDFNLIEKAIKAAIVVLLMTAYCWAIAPQVAKALGG